jgi:excisionase family DNA binding protein
VVIEEPLLLTIAEAARKLGCGRTLLYRLIASGELAEIHLGGAARIPSAAVEQLVERKLALAIVGQGDARIKPSRIPGHVVAAPDDELRSTNAWSARERAMKVGHGMGATDDTAIPSAIRRLGKGLDPETIATLVEHDLRERGLPQHVMCRWQREHRLEGEKKGRLILDGEGFPILKGFTAFRQCGTGIGLASDGGGEGRSGQRQRRSFRGEPIRTIAAAKQALEEMEAETGSRPGFGVGARGAGRDEQGGADLDAGGGGAGARGFAEEERTLGALIERMSLGLPVCMTSVEIIRRMRRMISRVFTAETRYDLLDRRAWQQQYEKTRTLCVLKNGAPRLGVVMSLKTSGAYWDAVVRGMDFAVDEGSLQHNLARGVKRRRSRQQWRLKGRAKPLEVSQVRDLELVIMAVAAAARRAVAEGRVVEVPVPLGGLPVARRFTQLVEAVALTGGKTATVTFGVAAIRGVPVVQVGPKNARYFGNGLEAMILMLYRSAPRASELLGLRRGSLDLEKREVTWEWRRHWQDGHQELAGRRLALIEYGVKNSIDGDPVTRGQRLSEGAAAAMRRWLDDLTVLHEQGLKVTPGYEDAVFPSLRAPVLSVFAFELLLYSVQEMSGVPESWPHRARHGLHALHALLDIDIADTAEQLGQTVETALRHYRLATGQGKRLAVERGEDVRRALDGGLSEDDIRARYTHKDLTGQASLKVALGPEVMHSGLAS